MRKELDRNSIIVRSYYDTSSARGNRHRTWNETHQDTVQFYKHNKSKYSAVIVTNKHKTRLMIYTRRTTEDTFNYKQIDTAYVDPDYK